MKHITIILLLTILSVGYSHSQEDNPLPPMPSDTETHVWGLDTTKNSLPHIPWCEYDIHLLDFEYEYLAQGGYLYFLTGKELVKFDPAACSELYRVPIDTSGIWKLDTYDSGGGHHRNEMTFSPDGSMVVIATTDIVQMYSTEDLSHIRTFSHHFNPEGDFPEPSKFYVIRDLMLSKNGRVLIYKMIDWDSRYEGDVTSVFSIEGEPLAEDVPNNSINYLDDSSVRVNQHLTGYFRIDKSWDDKFWTVKSYLYGEELPVDSLVIRKGDEHDRINHSPSTFFPEGISRLRAVTTHKQDGSEIDGKGIVFYPVGEDGRFLEEEVLQSSVDLYNNSVSYASEYEIFYVSEPSGISWSYSFATDRHEIVFYHGQPVYPYYKNSVYSTPSLGGYKNFRSWYKNEDNISINRFQYFKVEKGIYPQDWIFENYRHIYDSLGNEEFKDVEILDIKLERDDEDAEFQLVLNGENRFHNAWVVIGDKEYQYDNHYNRHNGTHYLDGYAPFEDLISQPFELVLQRGHNSRWIGLTSKSYAIDFTSVGDNSEHQTIFPNPFQSPGILELGHINSATPFDNVKLYDATGNLVLETPNSESIAIPELPSGVYHLVLSKAGTLVNSHRFVIGGGE